MRGDESTKARYRTNTSIACQDISVTLDLQQGFGVAMEEELQMKEAWQFSDKGTFVKNPEGQTLYAALYLYLASKLHPNRQD
jgi:hypothetical protein